MITLLLMFLGVFALAGMLLAGLLVRAFFDYQKRIEQVEDKYREREWEIFDRALVGQGIKPILKIEREKVLKVSDPEIPNETWTESAFNDDRIKEEIEQLYPEARRLPTAEVKVLYNTEWRKFEQSYRDMQRPLRVVE